MGDYVVSDEVSIVQLDGSGVAMAAMQRLNAKMAAQLSAQREVILDQQTEIAQLRARLAALDSMTL
jgi:hypothetical protein